MLCMCHLSPWDLWEPLSHAYISALESLNHLRPVIPAGLVHLLAGLFPCTRKMAPIPSEVPTMHMPCKCPPEVEGLNRDVHFKPCRQKTKPSGLNLYHVLTFNNDKQTPVLWLSPILATKSGERPCWACLGPSACGPHGSMRGGIQGCATANCCGQAGGAGGLTD